MSVPIVTAICTKFAGHTPAFRAAWFGLSRAPGSPKLPAVVVDRSTYPEAREALAAACGSRIKFIKANPGLTAAGAARLALREAHALAPEAWVLLMPYEYYALHDELPNLSRIIADQRSGVIIPDRFLEPRPIQHFPAWQQELEEVVNSLLGHLTGLSVDWCSGMRLIHPDCLGYFLKPHPLFAAADVDALLFPSTLSVAQAGLPVTSCALNFRRNQGVTDWDNRYSNVREKAKARAAKILDHTCTLCPESVAANLLSDLYQLRSGR